MNIDSSIVKATLVICAVLPVFCLSGCRNVESPVDAKLAQAARSDAQKVKSQASPVIQDLIVSQEQTTPRDTFFDAVVSDTAVLHSDSEAQQFAVAAEKLAILIRAGDVKRPATIEIFFDQIGIDASRLPEFPAETRIGNATNWITYRLNKNYEIEFTQRSTGGDIFLDGCLVRKVRSKN